MTALFRNGLFQSIAYGLMLGLLCLAPAALATTTDMGGLGALFGMIAFGGAIPAIIAGTTTWGWFVARRGLKHPAPTSFLVGLWFVTTVGAYLLAHVWIWGFPGCKASGVQSWLHTCLPGVAWPLDKALSRFVFGFILTAPVVLPLHFLGAWLWVRGLQPRLAGVPLSS